MSNPIVPELHRQETEMSKSDVYSLNTEKGMLEHREDAQIPATITEEDENENETGNVGAAAYEKSKTMAEIVSVDRVLHVWTAWLIRYDAIDSRAKPSDLEED